MSQEKAKRPLADETSDQRSERTYCLKNKKFRRAPRLDCHTESNAAFNYQPN